MRAQGDRRPPSGLYILRHGILDQQEQGCKKAEGTDNIGFLMAISRVLEHKYKVVAISVAPVSGKRESFSCQEALP